MTHVKEKHCLEDETTALVSCEISEKSIDIRTIYFVKPNLCLWMSTIISVHIKNDEFLEKNISIPRIKNTALVNRTWIIIPREPHAFWGLATEGMKNLVSL